MIKKLGFAAALAFSLSQGAFAGITFNATFTANVNTNFGGNAAAAESAFLAAANNIGSHYTDNININITVDGVAGTGTLGSSSQSVFGLSYAALYNAVLADATSADDATATGSGGSLGGNGTANSAADFVAGAHGWWATRSQLKALGLLADDLSNDGTITFGAGFAYTFNGPIAVGAFDFQAVAAHEISEIMGRIGISGQTIGGSSGYTLVDALSYSGAGTRVIGNGAGAFFSINAGNTLLKGFNDQAGNGGDSRDWAAGSNDAFNAFGTTGVSNPVTAVDFRILDAIGYDAAVPEPATSALLGSALLVLGVVVRRRKQ